MYGGLLVNALIETGRVDVHYMSLRTYVLGRFDVFHVHWPEGLVRHRTRLRSIIKAALAWVLLLRLTLSSTYIVRTVHNSEPHSTRTGLAGLHERVFLSLLERRTSAYIHLIRATWLATDKNQYLIPHGIYLSEVPARQLERDPNLVLSFGLIRRYKRLETLISAASSIRTVHGCVRVRMIGSVDELSYAQDLEKLATAAEISVDFRTLSNRQLEYEIARCTLVVVPYASSGNSGVVLHALSMRRPVLMPIGAATKELQSEVGPDWVIGYEGTLSAQTMLSALAASHALLNRGVTTRPDLTLRSWDEIARQTLRVYQVD